MSGLAYAVTVIEVSPHHFRGDCRILENLLEKIYDTRMNPIENVSPCH